MHESAPARANSARCDLGPLDHQVHVHGAAAVVDLVSDRRHDLGPEGDDRHEMAVHHVDVEGARAGIEHLDGLAAEGAEVGREDGRLHVRVLDPGRRHDPSLMTRH